MSSCFSQSDSPGFRQSATLLVKPFTTCFQFLLYCLVPQTTLSDQETAPIEEETYTLLKSYCSHAETETGPFLEEFTEQTRILLVMHNPVLVVLDPFLMWLSCTYVTDSPNSCGKVIK